MGDAREADSVLQILNDLFDRRKNKITTVAIQGEETARASGDFGDGRDRGG